MDSRLKVPTSIFEFFVEITRPKEGEEAQIKYVFPKDYVWNNEIKKQIPLFAWPMRGPNTKEEHFTFVLTDLDSTYKFGFCRSPARGETCLCLLSYLPWHKVFYRVLDKISDLILNHQDEVIDPFLSSLHDHPLPVPGVDNILRVVPNGLDSGLIFSFPLQNPKKLAEIPMDDNLTQFYISLHYNVILHLFANMIFERRIIITSNNLSLLSSTIHGALLLLYPLHWQHIFIPITPPHLLDYCAAPMPFLIGVHSSYMDIVRRMPTDDIVILDVDESTIESAHVEDLITLPSDVVSNLKHVMKKSSSSYGDTLTRSFMLAMVAMIGGYRSALKLRQGERDILFDEDQFFRSRPNMEDFLQKLLHFQHFRQFINSKIDKLKSMSIERDLFDNEVLAYEEELKGTEQVKAVFDKFISSTVEGRKKFAELGGKLGGNIKKQVKQAKVVMKKNMKQHKAQPFTNHYYSVHIGHSHHSAPFIVDGSRSNSLPIPEYENKYGPGSTPPNMRHFTVLGTVPKSRPPAKVIPYQRHVEGKKRLAHSLQQQHFSSEMPVDVLQRLTSPVSLSRPSSSTERSSLDPGECISVCSKGEGEEAAEVAIGNLIDISTDPAVNAIEECILDSISSSSISSCEVVIDGDPEPSSNGAFVPPSWEKFDDAVEMRPPLPPPRSELESFYSSKDRKSSDDKVEFVIGEESSPHESLDHFEPLEADQKSSPSSESPHKEFTSFLTEALEKSLEDLTKDVDVTSSSPAMGKKKWETFEGSKPTVVLEPTASSSTMTTTTSAGALSSSDTPILKDEVQRSDSTPTVVLQPTTSSSTMATTTSADTLSSGNTPILKDEVQISDSTPTVVLQATASSGAMTTTASAGALSFNNAPTKHSPSNLSPVHSSPLISTGSTTTAAQTLQARTDLFNTPHSPRSRIRTHSMSKSQYAVSVSILRPIPQEGVLSNDSITNPFYSGSINSGDYPALTKLSNRPLGPRSPNYIQTFPLPGSQAGGLARRLQHKRLPQKPEPYAGEYGLVKGVAADGNSNTNNAEERRGDGGIPFRPQRLPSLGVFDPFGDMFSSENETAEKHRGMTLL